MNDEHAKGIPEQWKGFSGVFFALGDQERQRIALAFGPGEELTAGDLAEASRLSRPTVSHHLGIMTRSGCLKREKRGREVFYSLDTGYLEEVFAGCLSYVRGVSGKDAAEAVSNENQSGVSK